MENTLSQEELIKTAQELEFHIAKRQEFSGAAKLAEEQVQAHTVEIKARLALLGIKRYEGTQYNAQFIVQNRESISKTKLVAAGVPADVIVACTDVNQVEQLRVTKKGA